MKTFTHYIDNSQKVIMADESKVPSNSSTQPSAESSNGPISRQKSSGSSEGIHPRSSSFKDSDKYERTKSRTFIRRDSDYINAKGMPDFRQAIKDRQAKTHDHLPQGLMREVLQTYKQHILKQRQKKIKD